MPTTASFSAIGSVADTVAATLKVSAFLALCPTVAQTIPQPGNLPYARIADFSETTNDTAGKHGRDVSFALHIFASGSPTMGAKKRAAAILSQAIALLDFVRSLAVTGLTLKDCQYEHAISQTEDVNGQEIEHLIATFRMRVTES